MDQGRSAGEVEISLLPLLPEGERVETKEQGCDLEQASLFFLISKNAITQSILGFFEPSDAPQVVPLAWDGRSPSSNAHPGKMPAFHS